MKRLWHIAWPGLLYLLLTILLTWPTAAHLSTHLPGDGGDDPAIAWNLWWVKYALLNQGQNPFNTTMLAYPVGLNLAFYTLTLLNALTALPLTLNFGVVAASNLHLFFTFAVGGYGTFLLTRYIVGQASCLSVNNRQDACPTIMAGLFYAFASSKLFYVALGQFNIASSHWIPFAVLYILRTRHQPGRWKNPLMAGLFLTLQAWTEMTYASFLLIFMGLYWVWEIVSAVRRTGILPVQIGQTRCLSYKILPHLLILLTFAIGISPILAQMLPDMNRDGDFMVEGSGFAESFSADALGFIIPTMHHPFLGQLIQQTNIKFFDKGQHIYLGFVLFGLTLIALLNELSLTQRRKDAKKNLPVYFWLFASFIFALLCLGPTITIDGQATPLSGPFVMFQHLPFFKGNRYPSRYAVMLILSLSVTAAFTLRSLATALRPTSYFLLSTLIVLLFLFEHLALPLPQSDMRPPTAYQIIANDPAQVTVLDIPFAWRNGFRITGALTTQFMFGQFYQTVHQKALLQANTSRNPEFKFQYFTRAPIINSLLALETGKPVPAVTWNADRAVAEEVLRFFNIKYIVVRPDSTGNPAVTPQATIPYIEAVLPVDKIHDEATMKIYQVRSTVKPSELLINAAKPLYFGEGWGLLQANQPVAAQRQAVQLLLPLSGAAQQITLRLACPTPLSQTVALELNGWQSLAQAVRQDWQTLTFNIPAQVVRSGLNDVWLNFGQTRCLSYDGKPDITVISAGEEVGSLGHIFVNGQDISPNQRGYNIAVMQDANFAVANFDTHLDPTASAKLADYLAHIPAQATLAIAASDEASGKLNQTAISALRAIGVAQDLRGCFRCSHAFIRLANGQTLEAKDSLQPVGLTTKYGLTEPYLAAWVDWIKIQ